uniref:Uncharacterized protein n=1 Tax=viral metagenome TaxID=1070528 RepID=A0A6M3M1G0_9ZZZZ
MAIFDYTPMYKKFKVEENPNPINPREESIRRKYEDYLENDVKEPGFNLGAVYESAKEGVKKPNNNILGAISGAIKGGLEYMGGSQGAKILSGLTSDPYMAMGYLDVAKEKGAKEAVEMEAYRKLKQEQMDDRSKYLEEQKKKQSMAEVGAFLKDNPDYYLEGLSATGNPMIRHKLKNILIDTVTGKAYDFAGNEVEPDMLEKMKSHRLTPSIKYQKEKAQVLGEAKQKVEEGKISSEQAGRYVLAKTAIDDIESAKKILFPTGKPESFRRDLAALSDMPFIGGAAPFSKEGQLLYSRLKSSVAAKVLLGTGVAARPEEVEAQIKSYVANWKTHPEAAIDEFDRLIKFYKDYLQLAEKKRIDKTEPKQEKSIKNVENVRSKYDY